MSEAWDSRYHDWLLDLIDETGTTPEFTHYMLLERLDRIAYVVHIPMDQNRADDGKYLRVRFAEQMGENLALMQRTREASMLEVFVALAERMLMNSLNEDTFDTVGACFWDMMRNMGLASYVDAAFMDDPVYFATQTQEVCRLVNHHQYTRLGVGGPFPVIRFTYVLTSGDARKSELWTQMGAYLLENADIAS